MMSTVKQIGLMLVFLCLSSFSYAQEFKQGVHYHVLPLEKSGSPTLTKYFSFYCAACYAIEPHIQSFEKIMPEGVSFYKVHVDFVRGASPEILTGLGKAAILAKASDRGAAFHNIVFRQIHQEKKPFRNNDDVIVALMGAGLQREQAEKGLRSFSVNAQHSQGVNRQKELVTSRHLQGVPTLIVNNRYRIDHTKLSTTNFSNELTALTEFLLSLP